MELVSLKQLFQRLSNGGRLLGLDVGSRNIGLAVSDLNCRVASPHRFKKSFISFGFMCSCSVVARMRKLQFGWGYFE